VLEVLISPVSTILRLDIGTVSTMLYFFFLTFLILLNILAEGITPNIPLGEVRQPFEIFGNFTQEDIGGGSIEVHSRGHDNVSNPDDIDRFLNGD
jgi:hypothetical protein